MIGINKLPMLSDDEDTQHESHIFVAFAVKVSLDEVNQKISNLDNSLSDDEEDFPDLQTAYDALLGEF